MIGELQPVAVVAAVAGLAWLLGMVTGLATGRQWQQVLIHRLRTALTVERARLAEREYQLTTLLEPVELPCGRCLGEGEARGCPSCGQQVGDRALR